MYLGSMYYNIYWYVPRYVVCIIIYIGMYQGTVVGDNINIIKTTFELNFDFYQAFKQYGYTKIWKQREDVNLKSLTLITCKLVI